MRAVKCDCIVLSLGRRFKYECRVGNLFVLSWARVRWVSLGSFFSRMMYVEWYGVNLLCFLLLRYVLTMVICMCFMFVLICALFMVLVSVV